MRIHQSVRHYVERVTRTREEECHWISRELHDDTIQVLYGLARQIDNFVRDNLLTYKVLSPSKERPRGFLSCPGGWEIRLRFFGTNRWL